MKTLTVLFFTSIALTGCVGIGVAQESKGSKGIYRPLV